MEWKDYSKRNNLDYSNSWLITYTDMITIILCFFIVFFLYSAEETSMLRDIRASLSQEVDVLNQENQELKEEQESLKSLLFPEDKLEGDDFLDFLRRNQLEDSVYITQLDKGLLIRFKEGVLFSSGQASISDKGYLVLDQIADKIRDLPNSIVVEGYTDSTPTKLSGYPSNWELSVDRAIKVAKYLMEEKAIGEDRISVRGYGEQDPIASNLTEEGRQSNRRIEIIILN